MEVFDLRTEYKHNPIGIGTTSPRLSWKLKSKDKNTKQAAYQILVAKPNTELSSEENFVWNTGKVVSDQSVHIPYEGPKLRSGQRLYWKIKVWDNYGNVAESEKQAFWEMGMLNPEEWEAEWITLPWSENPNASSPCPYFRNVFYAYEPIIEARIYVSALGLYELELNGERVGDELFTPGWTNYHKRLQYQVYDVTKNIKLGKNVIGAIVGDGWYRGHFGWWENNRNNYGERLALLVQLKLVFRDGSKILINSDDTWKSNTGPLLKSDIYNGETYDARLEMEGWSTSSFDDSTWENVKILNHPKNILVESVGEKVKKVLKISPKKLLTTPKGEKVFDLGQNMVGWVKLKVAGKAGDKVTLKFAEVLDSDGNFYTENLRNIECSDQYILKGYGEETYEPRFTFHGFRYVMIQGYPADLTLNSIKGVVIHSDMDQTGKFRCSDPLINQLQNNIEWGQRGNFLDVPTDCPQRDERLGWTGDAQVFAPTASFNFQTASFFTKWLKDLESEQREDGSVPWVVPNIIKDGGGTGWSDGFGATGWADAAVIIPWTLYQYYGDVRILEEQFSSMKNWIEYMRKHAGDSFIFKYGFHFGDWLSFAEYHSYQYNAPDYGYAGAHTDKELIATAYFYYSTSIVEKSARLIGENNYADELRLLLPKIKQAWNNEFTTNAGRLVSNTQTAFSLALVFDLISDEKKEMISRRLAKDVEHFSHLTTGFLGTPILNFALSDSGRTDLAYLLLKNKRYPSWLYPITKGATTIWERWDGIKPDDTFQTVGMNSFNHYAYGAIGDWLYSRLAGIRIDPDQPGYKNIIFTPSISTGIEFVEAGIETMYGLVFVKWKIDGNKVRYDIQIPPNCTAKIMLPSSEKIEMDGMKINKSDLTNLEIGSGNHTVTWLI